MLLRRLLAVSGRVGLRRPLSTAASRPPWILVDKVSMETDSSATRACVSVVEPPRVSRLCLPANLVNTNAAPDPDSTRFNLCCVCSASCDGLLFLYVSLYDCPIHDNHNQVPGSDPSRILDTARFVCNALTGQLSRLPALDMGGPKLKLLTGPRVGLLTQADRGHGPPNRFAVADLRRNMMLRFLSETGEWEIVKTAPCQLPLARQFDMRMGIWDQETFAFGGRLWWVDLTWGAISADPFSDRPETQFVELPTGSVLPERTLPEVEQRELGRYRRMGVSEGRLRYAELSEREPFMLSVFALDEDGSGWTLEHHVEVVVTPLRPDGGDPSLPLPEKKTPQIAAIDPLDSSVIYLKLGMHVLGMDMNRGEVTGASLGLHTNVRSCVPCVLPPWLGSSRIL